MAHSGSIPIQAQVNPAQAKQSVQIAKQVLAPQEVNEVSALHEQHIKEHLAEAHSGEMAVREFYKKRKAYQELLKIRQKELDKIQREQEVKLDTISGDLDMLAKVLVQRQENFESYFKPIREK